MVVHTGEAQTGGSLGFIAQTGWPNRELLVPVRDPVSEKKQMGLARWLV